MIVISIGIDQLSSYISQQLAANQNISIILLGLLVLIVGWIINIETSFAQLAIYFKFTDSKPTTLKELFSYFDFKLLFRFFLVSLIFNTLCIVGYLLFIFPGIYFNTKYWFAAYIYVDRRTGVIESFKESAKLTQGIKTQLFLLGLLQFLIQLGGLLALVVGLFIAVPINYLSDLYVYRKLTSKS